MKKIDTHRTYTGDEMYTVHTLIPQKYRLTTTGNFALH